MVLEKIHSRARGMVQSLTRQPLEGRSKEGGLRFGEMERDCMIAHGMSYFLRERFFDTSDGYEIHVCKQCGLFAHRIARKDAEIYFCQQCKSGNNITKVKMVYAFKLFLQELQAINILMRIKVD